MARRSLDQSHVLVTGASSGIGAALARAFAAKRARLLLTARRADLLADLVAECTALGGQAECLAGDIVDSALRGRLIARAVELWGGLDLLVNNAGVSAHGRFEENGEPVLRQVMEVNFFAAAELTRLALPLLKAGRRPAVVNVGSILSHRSLPFNSEYAASKFALRGWADSLRAELHADGVDVVMVYPGSTDTEFFEHVISRKTALPWAGNKNIPPSAVARQTLRALERGRREIYPNWRGRALVLANRMLPSWVDRAILRMANRPSRD